MGSPRWRRNRRLKCVCGGYAFPHRRTGGCCFLSPRGMLNDMLRQGVDYMTAVAHAAYDSPGTPCPAEGDPF
jgi:hypothetical protein